MYNRVVAPSYRSGGSLSMNIMCYAASNTHSHGGRANLRRALRHLIESDMSAVLAHLILFIHRE